jgi:predicted transcriptional regulator
LSERHEIMMPTYDRLSKSMLKAATLIAASRQREHNVVVEEEDIVRAAYYGMQWRSYVDDIMENVGKSHTERMLDHILQAVIRRSGCTRSTLMQNYHLSAREMTSMLETLEQRGLVTRAKTGRTETIYPVMRG